MPRRGGGHAVRSARSADQLPRSRLRGRRARVDTRVSAAVRVRVSDRERVGDLKAFLEAAGCSVREVGNVTLDVEIDRAPSDSQASREITIYLKTWQAMHPETHARVVREDGAG